MTVDPIASLRVWAVELELAGRTFQVPGLPAADWLPLLLAGDVFGVIDLMDDSAELDELIVTGEVDPRELTDAVHAVVEQACGRPVHVAILLAGVARTHWPLIGGELARAGFRWDQVPIAAALDAIRSVVMAHVKKDSGDRLQALFDSDVPPAGMVGPTASRRRRIDRRQAMADFQEMAGPPTVALGPPPAPVPANGGPSAGGPPRTPPPPQRHPQGGP